MKILLIFTGGTIGSALQDGYIGTNHKQPSILLNMFEKYTTHIDARLKDIHFDTISPYTILSENMDFTHLKQLRDCVAEHIYDYDGIIITHGTDTLQYTAAGLSYLFSGANIPILLVSSNYILEDEKANGFANFVGAVSFINENHGTGVFVSYQNNYTHEGSHPYAPVYIHRGNYLHPHEVYTDAVYSIDNAYWGYYRVADTPNGYLYSDYQANPNYQKLADKPLTLEHNPFYLASAKKWRQPTILCLQCNPDMYFPRLDAHIDGILIKAYHSGTLPTASDTFISFCQEASRFDIPIFVAGNMLTTDETSTQYESTSTFSELKLQILPKGTLTAMYMKICLVYGLQLDTTLIFT